MKLYDFVEEKTGYLSIVKYFELLGYKIIILPFYSYRVSFFHFAFFEKNVHKIFLRKNIKITHFDCTNVIVNLRACVLKYPTNDTNKFVFMILNTYMN